MAQNTNEAHQVRIWNGFQDSNTGQRYLKKLGPSRDQVNSWTRCAALVQNVCLVDIQICHYLRQQERILRQA